MSEAPEELRSKPYSEKAVLTVVTAISRGAPAVVIANITGLSYGHTRRCLYKLRSQSFVRQVTENVDHYYDLVTMKLWKPMIADRWIVAFPHLPTLVSEPYTPPPARLPPDLWCYFWSGMDPADLDPRVPEHAKLIGVKFFFEETSQMAKSWAF